jgi:hypothetical protein
MFGGCSYPISLKKWILSFGRKSPAAMECTGASPQRCVGKKTVSIWGKMTIRMWGKMIISTSAGARGADKNEERGQERRKEGEREAHLVVEPARLVEELEELGVDLAPPEVHVGDLEVGPDCGEVG